MANPKKRVPENVAGDFFVDPWEPVARAVITHAHGDHARPGSRTYLATPGTRALLHRRLGPETQVQALEYGERLRLADVTVSLHPAGHVLGSAQVRIEGADGVWVVAGDYKRAADPTRAPFEVVTAPQGARSPSRRSPWRACSPKLPWGQHHEPEIRDNDRDSPLPVLCNLQTHDERQHGRPQERPSRPIIDASDRAAARRARHPPHARRSRGRASAPMGG